MGTGTRRRVVCLEGPHHGLLLLTGALPRRRPHAEDSPPVAELNGSGGRDDRDAAPCDRVAVPPGVHPASSAWRRADAARVAHAAPYTPWVVHKANRVVKPLAWAGHELPWANGAQADRLRVAA